MKSFKVILLMALCLYIMACSATPSKRSTGEVIDDNVILLKLRTKLVKNKIVQAGNIKLTIWKGVVSMNGVMATQSEINRAIEIAEQQLGVKEVKAYLVLDSQNEPVDPHKKSAWSFLSAKKSKNNKDEEDVVQESDLIEEEGTKQDQKSTNQNKDQDVDKTTKETVDYKEFEY